jgi:hypothetical protein
MRSYKQRIARLSRQLELAGHLATNMDLDTKLATIMGADDLHLYLPSHQVLAPGHQHTGGSEKVGATSTSLHNPTALRLLELYRDTSSQLKRQRKGGLPCKGTSCLRRSFDGSKRCTQHPELANLLVELQRTQRWFTHECWCWCHGPQDWLYIHGTPNLMSPKHWPESFWPNWAAHPSVFCDPGDSSAYPVFNVRWNGEWMHPDETIFVDVD